MGSELEIAAGLCRRFEGLRLQAYYCPANVLTIGYGATGRDIYPGMTVTKEWAEDRLQRDLARFMRGAKALCPQADGNALAALTDFAFNLGLGRLQQSTLRRVFNAGDMDRAKVELMRWTRGGGKILRGLVLRREAEAALL